MPTAHRPVFVLFAALALAVLGVAVLPLRGSAQAQGPVSIPKDGEGYQITKTDSSQKAPSGFEGKTDTSTQTAGP